LRLRAAPRPGRSLRPFLLAAACGALLVGAPLAALVAIAVLGDSAILAHVWRNVLPVALLETAMLLAGIAVVTSIAGVGTAWLVVAYDFPGRRLLAPALMLPLAVPTYLVAYAYVEVLDPLGPVQTLWRRLFGYASRAEYAFPEVRSLPGAILVMGFVLYPYLYMSARSLFAQQSAALLEVGRTLGCGPVRLFRHVALPLARPAVALGLSLVLLEALNDIGASEYLGVRTLSVSIYTTWLNRGSLPGAAQIAVAMLAVVALILLAERHARGRRRFDASLKRPRPVAPFPLRGWRAGMATLACALPVLLGFAVPAGLFAWEAFQRIRRDAVDPDLPHQLAATVTLAGVACALIVVLGTLIAVAVRLIPRRRVVILARIAGLGYAVPGTVLAVGLLWPLAGFDNLVAEAWRGLTGSAPGLLLMGSGAAIIIAYASRFLGIAIGGVESGYARISPRMDDAARALGHQPRDLVREVHLPLLRPALASAALLVFVDAAKELPATLLLRPLNLETLATAVYADAARGSFEDGAIAALLIVAVGLLPVVLAARAASPRHADQPGRPTDQTGAPAALAT
jgi:iron(III) transport system permease protein